LKEIIFVKKLQMRYILIILMMGLLLSCGKDECNIPLNNPSISNQNVYDADISSINQYLQDNNLIANSTASGLHYIIDEAGSESKPELCDEVIVKYLGYRLDGVQFDSSSRIKFPLTNLISAWKEGIPLIGKSGTITLLCPSYLAYGPSGQGSLIPGNTVLIFEIELQDF